MLRLTTIDDLSSDEIDHLIARARELEGGEGPAATGICAALVFLSSSIRTRVGFASAVHRLGGTTIDVHEPRYSLAMSAAESITDLLRTVSGMVDVTVLRADVAFESCATADNCRSAFINAGDTFHHPSQALIDVWSIQEEVGSIDGLHVVMLGDATMRAARSLLMYFARCPPGRLTLVGPPSRLDHGVAVGDSLAARLHTGGMDAVASADVVYAIGLAPGVGPDRVDDIVRKRYRLDGEAVSTMRDGAIVLCPLPVIDEITDEARTDPRMRFWPQSDRSVSMRMAILEHVTAR